MSAAGLGESGFLRVVVIAGTTAAVMIAMLFAKPFYSATTDIKAASSADINQPIADEKPKAETASFVASPTIDTNAQFFFGTGDGSAGYYADQSQR